MIEELLEAKLISPAEFKLYKLFSSEIGQECLKTMMDEMFWEEPEDTSMTCTLLAFFEGRRSVLRAIKANLEKVQAAINKQLTPEDNND